MRIIQETVKGSIDCTSILEEYFSRQQMVVADIETTGLSPRRNSVILGGMASVQGEERQAVQYFADRPEYEAELLERYTAALSRFDVIVTYNGNSFDLPFLKKRMKAAGLGTDPLEELYSFDLYRILKKYSMLPKILPDLKQKTVENYMGIHLSRTDRIDGAESVRLYELYLRRENPGREQILDRILLHNRDDVLRLSELLKILHQMDLHRIFFYEGFPVISQGKKALIRQLQVNRKGMVIEGTVFGKQVPYQSFADGMEMTVDEQGSFSIRAGLEEVEGFLVADLWQMELDGDQLSGLPGYESGYLILLDPGKQVRYHEVNQLAGKLTAWLLGKLD